MAGSEITKWFEHDRFGMFIHWGLYAISGRDMWYYSNEEIDKDEYEKYFHRFNPVDYDAKKWAKICRNAGMKYAVLTTKHHEGFCMWDSKMTDFTVMQTKFKRDIVKEWVEEFRAEGLKVGFYFSIIDWHHPDYIIDWMHPQRARKDELNKNRDWDRYLAFMNGQIDELMQNYGNIDIFWTDFCVRDNLETGEKGKSAALYHAKECMARIREMQPGIIINNRFGTPGEIDSDFSTPEQYIPKRDVSQSEGAETEDVIGGWGVGGVSCWESCITMGSSWGYYRADTAYKTAKTIVRSLVECASNNGNLLLNIGPTPRGRLQPEYIAELEKVGEWLNNNGESVYGCGFSPISAGSSAPLIRTLVTQNGKDVYLHCIEDCPTHPFFLLNEDIEIDYIEFLNDKTEIVFSKERYCDKLRYRLHIPVFKADPLDTVIHIVLK